MKDALQQYKIYGLNLKNFELMVTKQFKRLQKKIKNAEKHFNSNIPVRFGANV